MRLRSRIDATGLRGSVERLAGASTTSEAARQANTTCRQQDVQNVPTLILVILSTRISPNVQTRASWPVRGPSLKVGLLRTTGKRIRSCWSLPNTRKLKHPGAVDGSPEEEARGARASLGRYVTK
jgi:hypothetical protein